MRSVILLVVGVAAVGALTGCNAAADADPGDTPPVKVVQLGREYSQQAVVLSVDQELVVRLDHDVLIANPGQPTTCESQPGKVIGFDPCPNPADREIRYVAHRAGTTTLSTPVAPRCDRDEICPTWAATAHLRVTVRARRPHRRDRT